MTPHFLTNSSGRLIAVFFFVVFSVFSAMGQSGFSAKIHGVYAFNTEKYEMQDDYLKVAGKGYTATIGYNYRPLNWKIHVGLEVGFKQLFTRGEISDLHFRSRTTKLLAIFNCLYSIHDKWSAGFAIPFETNKDFETFKPDGADHFRYNLGLVSAYRLQDRITLDLLISRCLYPNRNVYMLSNPSEQIMLGISYQLSRRS